MDPFNTTGGDDESKGQEEAATTAPEGTEKAERQRAAEDARLDKVEARLEAREARAKSRAEAARKGLRCRSCAEDKVQCEWPEEVAAGKRKSCARCVEKRKRCEVEGEPQREPRKRKGPEATPAKRVGSSRGEPEELPEGVADLLRVLIREVREWRRESRAETLKIRADLETAVEILDAAYPAESEDEEGSGEEQGEEEEEEEEMEVERDEGAPGPSGSGSVV